MEVVWSGFYQSESGQRRKDGTLRQYRVTLFDEGQAACACPDYIIRGVNSGRLGYRCKHIMKAASEHPGWSSGAAGATKVKRPKAPTAAPTQGVTSDKPTIVPIDPDDLERRARRRI